VAVTMAEGCGGAGTCETQDGRGRDDHPALRCRGRGRWRWRCCCCCWGGGPGCGREAGEPVEKGEGDMRSELIRDRRIQAHDRDLWDGGLWLHAWAGALVFLVHAHSLGAMKGETGQGVDGVWCTNAHGFQMEVAVLVAECVCALLLH
jgi:hypothetical protein